MKRYQLFPAFRAVAVIGCVVASLSLRLTVAHAFSVSPPVVDLEGEPGATVRGSVRITNTAERLRVFDVSVQRFVARGEEGQQDFVPEFERSGLASWIVPATSSVRLDAGEARDVTYTIQIPPDAEPGGHYAALFFASQPLNGQGESAVGIGAKIGVLFLMRVSGDILEEARVDSFRERHEGTLNRLPALFELRIQNLGNVHLRPEGHIVIRNMFDSVVEKIPVNPQRVAVLPMSIRRIESSWSKAPDAKKDGFVTEIANEWNNFAIGRYTAELSATYGKTRQPVIGRVTFWVVPWRLLLSAAFLVILLLVAARAYNRLLVRSLLARARQKRSS